MKVERAKLFLEADIKIEKETSAMREMASSIIKLPEEKEKQIDLLYFSAVFVSSGENLNHAYFMPSELVAAENTIINKALDVEHREEDIIGHIYERAFMNKSGAKVDLKELSSMEKANLDQEEMHVLIAGIIYKDRFPAIAKEVSEGKWKVSMETYFTHFDVKVGEMIIPSTEAERMGIASAKYLGKTTKIFRDGVEVASGVVTRVLRNLCFSGCGIVDKPANPVSFILEVAGIDEDTEAKTVATITESESGEVIVNINKDNNVTYKGIDDTVSDYSKSDRANSVDDAPGACVSYRKWVYDGGGDGPNPKILHENWCTLYDVSCTSFYRSALDSECLRFKAYTVTDNIVNKLIKKSEGKEKSKRILSSVEEVFRKAEKFIKNKED